MNRSRLARDVAWQLARDAVRVFSPLLRDEELVDAQRELFAHFGPAIEQLLERYDRDRQRARATTEPVPEADTTEGVKS